MQPVVGCEAMSNTCNSLGAAVAEVSMSSCVWTWTMHVIVHGGL